MVPVKQFHMIVCVPPCSEVCSASEERAGLKCRSQWRVSQLYLDVLELWQSYTLALVLFKCCISQDRGLLQPAMSRSVCIFNRKACVCLSCGGHYFQGGQFWCQGFVIHHWLSEWVLLIQPSHCFHYMLHLMGCSFKKMCIPEEAVACQQTESHWFSTLFCCVFVLNGLQLLSCHERCS